MKHSKILLILAAATLAIIYYHENKTVDKFDLTQFIEIALIQQNKDKKETSAVLYKFAELFLKYADEKPIAQDCLLAAYDHLTDDEKILYVKKIFSPIFFIESFNYLDTNDAKDVISLAKLNKPDKNILTKLYDNNLDSKDQTSIRNYAINFFKNIGNSKSADWKNYFSHRVKDNLSITDLNNFIDSKINRELNIGRAANALSVTNSSAEDILVYITTAYNKLTNTHQICQSHWVPCKDS
jgi:hypothetical protein